MAEHEEPSETEQIEVKPRGSPSSFESHSETEKEKPEPSALAVKAKVFRLFGREKPVRHVFGGGQGTFRSDSFWYSRRTFPPKSLFFCVLFGENLLMFEFFGGNFV